MDKRSIKNKVVRLLTTTFIVILLASIFQSSVIIAQVSQSNDNVNNAHDVIHAHNLTLPPRPTQQSQPQEALPSFLRAEGGFQPVTQLRTTDHACTEDPHQPLQKVLGLFEKYSNTSQLFQLPTRTVNATQPVACPFRTTQPYWKHFAHAMQQLYACYSFYQQFSLSNPKVFVIPSQLQKQLDTNPFLHGFIRFLRDEVKVKIISPSDVESSEYLSPANTFSPGGYILSHTAELNRQILNFLSIPEDLNGSCSDDVLKPRIGILNRRPALGRSLKDTDRLVNILKDLSRDNSVSVEYFEGSSFAEQVGFFRRIDIMLSPHGAQNTGIPFMANKKCAHILEVFPDKYLLPTFYGSLARNSGIGYSYVYMSAGDERTSTNDDLSFAGRVQARAANICLSSEVIREYVASLAEDWRTCCREQ